MREDFIDVMVKHNKIARCECWRCIEGRKDKELMSKFFKRIKHKGLG